MAPKGIVRHVFFRNKKEVDGGDYSRQYLKTANFAN